MYYYLIVLVVIFLFNLIIVPWLAQRQIKDASYSKFLNDIDQGIVEKVQLDENQIVYQVKEDEEVKLFQTGKIDDPTLVSRLEEADINFAGTIQEQPNFLIQILLGYGVPILIFVLIGRMVRRNMMNRLGDSGLNIPGAQGAVTVYEPDEDTKTFADVAGQEEAKESLTEVIDFLNQPEKYEKVGARSPKGVLLVGPPGTGKTLMAKAVAGEANVPFFAISGSEFVEMFVGRGAAKVRELFEQAEKHAPCIVFIDEIDTIGKSRDNQMGSNDEREQTLNQLLTEMDGFEGNQGVVILAATNRPEVLDPALLRPGRFDRQVPMELPDLKGREDILKVHLRDVVTAEDIDHNLIARMTSGASGAQVANIVNEAAIRTVRDNREKVTTEDLVASIETVIAGAEKKNAILSDQEKKIVAYHEIGHALVAAKQTESAPVQKITIVPRTSGALGYVMQVEEDERSLVSKTEMLNQIAVLCAGRAAEEVVFGEITTGASNDIEKATSLVRQMITQYGMSDKFGMVNLAGQSSQYLGGEAQLNCSNETSHLVDLEVQKIIAEAFEDAKRILNENREQLDDLAAYLYEEETIPGKQFMEILAETESTA
ncbi:MAG: ATP-dependent zinc metalloprotease FtsH [Clostridiaceae bacterium]|nr:ATP-dependent zinc metalloprotease FtsH [Clostridiaceae bacterium]